MSIKQIRLSFEPFERIMRGAEQSDAEFAESIGRNKDNLRRYRKNGLLFYKADELAIQNGMHPSYIWGDAYWYPEKPHPYVVQLNQSPRRTK